MNNTDLTNDVGVPDASYRSAAKRQAGSPKSSSPASSQMTAGDWFGSAYGMGGMSGAVETVVKKKESAVNNTDSENDVGVPDEYYRSAAEL